MEYFSVIGGLILLVLAADHLVEGSVAIAEKLHVSKLIIGITVVALGTSAPEMMVGIDAALSNAPEIALGNIVGSNIANILLVLGIPALFYPFTSNDKETKHSLAFMIFATGLFIILAAFGPLHWWHAIILLTALVFFLYYSVKRAQANMTVMKYDIKLSDQALEDLVPVAAKEIPIIKAILYVIFGLIGLMYGAHILVDGAVIIAQKFGVSEAVIGLTIIAIGTSLPELVTSLMAAKNNHGDVALGNIIGSNLFNILAIMGVTSLISPVVIPPHFFYLDFPIMMITTLMLIPIVMGKVKINRLIGGIFSILYISYLTFLGIQSNLI